MPRTPRALPAQLHGTAFRPRDWDLTARRVRAADLWAPTPGTRLPAGAITVGDRCAAFSLVLAPGTVFTHQTAATLLGLPLPWTADKTIHAIVPPHTRAPRRHGFTGHQQLVDDRDIARVGPLRVTAAARVFCDLADTLKLTDLVALGDAVARRTSLEHLESVVLRHPLPRRKREAALKLIDPRAESPKESELRAVLVLAGLGPFTANHVVRDARGVFVARVDLALPHLRIALEYEGDHHRDRDQWRRDIARRRRLEALGWIYLPVTQTDLNDLPTLLHDLRAAIATRT